jgi:hypothetical protein
MFNAEKAKLEQLLSRKRKADLLPLNEQIKWKHEIEKIEKEIGELEEKLGHFNLEKALELLHKANRELNLKLQWNKWGNGINVFLEENETLNNLIINACKEVDSAFENKSMELLEKAVGKYRAAYIRVNKIYNNAGRQMGFRELIETDEEYGNRAWD